MVPETFCGDFGNANELVKKIHDRMPSILEPEHNKHWLGSEPNVGEVLIAFLSQLLRI